MGPGTQPTKPAAAKPTKPAAAKPIKPAAAKPAPAPPPTQPQKQATQAKCDCPLAVHKPCDVDTLNIQFEHSVDDPDAPPDPATTAGSLPKKMEFAQAIKSLAAATLPQSTKPGYLKAVWRKFLFGTIWR